MPEKTSFIRSKAFLVMVILLMFILIMTFFFGENGIIEIINNQRKIDYLEKQVEILNKEKKQLQNEIRELKENSLAVEKAAREKLGLMKKEEKVIVVVPEKDRR